MTGWRRWRHLIAHRLHWHGVQIEHHRVSTNVVIRYLVCPTCGRWNFFEVSTYYYPPERVE